MDNNETSGFASQGSASGINNSTVAVLSEFLRRVLGHPKLLLFFGLIFFLLKVPVLDTPVIGDDLIQLTRVTGSAALESHNLPHVKGSLQNALLNYFTFASGDPAENMAMKQYGILPWWSDEDIHMAFFRPISSFTHWLDFTLWPNNFVLMHLQNIFWFFAVIFLLKCVLSQLSAPKAVVTLALIVFALDIGLASNIYWISARNTSIGMVFVLLSFYLHIRGREHNQQAKQISAWFVFAIALFSAESAVAGLAFIAAYELVYGRNSMLNKLLHGLPYVVVTALWRVIYTSVGNYGVSGSTYVDPIADPASFLQNIFWSLPRYILETFTGATSVYKMTDVHSFAFLLICIIYIASLITAYRSMFKSSKLTRFAVLGLLISMVPVASIIEENGRHQAYLSVFGSLLIAQLLNYVYQNWRSKSERKIVRVVQTGFFFYFLIVNIFLSFLVHASQSYALASMPKNSCGLPSNYTDAEYKAMGNKNVIVVNSPHPVMFSLLPYMLDYCHYKIPEHYRLLAPAANTLELHRISENEFLLRNVSNEPLLPSEAAEEKNLVKQEHKIARYALMLGSKHFDEKNLDLEDVSIEITKLIENQPYEILVKLRSTASEYYWLAWSWKTNCLEKLSLPKVGDKVTI